MRRGYARIPILLALLALALLYLLRWPLLEEPLGAAIEAAVFDALGVRVEIGVIRGNLLREIRIEGLRTTQTNTEGTVHSLDLNELVVGYRLGDLLPFLSLTHLQLPHFTSPGLDITWLERDDLTAGGVVSNVSRAIPTSLTIDLRGVAVVDVAEQRSSTRFEVRFDELDDADESRTIREARIELSEMDSPWWPGGSGDTLSLVFGMRPGRLTVRTDGEESSQGVRIDGALESSDADGLAALTRAHLTAAVDRFRARATADAQMAELTASLPADDKSTDFVNETLARGGGAAGPGAGAGPSADAGPAEDAQPSATADAKADAQSDAEAGGAAALDTRALVVGGLELDASLRLSQEVASAGSGLPQRSVVAELFSAPAALMQDAELTASIEARSWRLESVGVRRLASSARWAGGRLSVGESSATIWVEGLDLSTASEPDAGATVSVEAAAWNPEAQEVQIDELVVRGGGGLLRVDGLVTLPPDGSVLGNLRGDLGGRLSVERPGEVAALLARIGVVPSLPDGYSVGSSVAFDFALRGPRADAQLDVGLRVQDPAVPGFAFDTVEADASLTPGSVTVSRLLVRTAEARSAGDGSGRATVLLPGAVFRPGTVFRLDEPFAVSWGGVGGVGSFGGSGASIESGVSVGAFALRSEFGTLTGSGTLATDRLEAELAASSVPLEFLIGLLDPDLSAEASGTVSVRVSAEGDPESPTVGLRAEGDSLAIADEPVTIALDVRQEAGEVQLSTLKIDLAGLAEISGTGSAPVALGRTGLTTGDFADSEMRIDASLPGVIPYLLPGAAEQWPEATLDLTATLDGRAGSVRAVASGFERADELTIVGLEPITEFQLAASVDDVLDPPSTLTAELTSGEVVLASVEADLDSGLSGEAHLPVAELSHFVPGVEMPGGLVRASFRVPNDGSGAQGEVALDGVMVKFSPQVPTLTSLTGSLVYADDTISMSDLAGEMGGGAVSLSGTYSFAEDDESPIDIRLAGRNALLARSPDLRVRADLDAELVGSFESMRLSGNVGVTEARYTRPVQLFSLGTTAASPSADLQLFGVDADWARSMLLNVAVTADRTIVMSNNLFDGALSADMTIGGNLAVPRPSGRVFTDTGTVRLPTARMNVEDLELRFPADAAFAPQIRLAAATSVQGYDMSVTVDGQLPSVEVRIVSAPPLPTDEAILLLTTGSRSSELSFTPDVSGTLTAVGTVVGRQVLNQLSRQMSDEEREFLERIDFEVERKRETGQIGEVGVEYQLDDDENWVLRFDRSEEERYTLQLAWRLWIE